MAGLWPYRKLILASWLLLTLAGAGWLAMEFRVDNSVGVWFADDDPELRTYRDYLADWGELEWTLALLHCDDVRAPEMRPALTALSQRLEGQQHCHKVLSAASLPVGHPLAEKLFYRPTNRHHTLLLLQTDNFFERAEPYRAAMLKSISEELAAANFINEFHVVGTSVVNAELNEAAVSDMVVFFTSVTLLLTLSSLVLLRSARDTVVLLSIALSTVGITLGLIVACGYSLNIVTIMLPTVLIALSTADAVHMIHAFHMHRRDMSSRQAAAAAVKELWLPCLGTTITTVAGFMSLAGSPVLPVYQLAVFCSFGIACAWVVSVVAAPLLLVQLWPDDDTRPERQHKDRIAPLLQRLIARPGPVVICFVLLCGALAGLPRLTADTNYVEFFREGAAVPMTYALLDEAGFPQSPLVVVLDREGTEAARSAFVDGIRELKDVRGVVAPAPGLTPLLGLESDDGTQQRVFVLARYLGSRELLALVDRIRVVQQQHLPTTEMTVTGTTLLWANMDSSVIATQKTSLLIIAPVMLLVLCVLFRSLRLGVIGWVLSCLPVALIMGLMGFLGIEINIATVLIAGVTLGLAVDDSIHLIFSFREARQRGLDGEQSADEVLRGSGTRVALTTLIVMGGFLCMALSAFQPTSNFGMLTCLTIFVAALIDLTLLPLILKRIYREPELVVEGGTPTLEGPASKLEMS
jgi:predicted RND superfamily exporter protein